MPAEPVADCTLVLLPGLDGTGLLFRPLLDDLPGHIHPRIIAFPRDRPLGYRELLPAVLDALPTSSPFILLGESFSGPLAVMAAATRPAMLRGVVLSASFIRCPLGRLPSWADRLVQPWQFRLWPAMAGARLLLGRHSTPAVRQLMRQALSEARPEVMAHRVREAMRIDASVDLEQCPVPLLYLRGTHDRLIPTRNLRSIQALQPDLQVESIAAPHQLLQAQPRSSARAISAFARAVCAVGPRARDGDPAM